MYKKKPLYIFHLIGFVVFFLLVFPIKGQFAPDNTAIYQKAAAEANWILRGQLANGVILMHPDADLQKDGGDVNPYFTNLTLSSILELDAAYIRLGGTAVYAGKVKKYLVWYFRHLNKPDRFGISGTIYDYKEYLGNKEICTYDYDSSDSYAATFLSLAYQYYKVTGDGPFLRTHLADLKMIANAIDATLIHPFANPQGIHLTYAKKNYKTAYLMDNVEVYRGYKDFSWLLELLQDRDASLYDKKSQKIRAAIEAHLWQRDKKKYAPYYRGACYWNQFYPDAVANLWPVIFNLPEASARASLLWSTFISKQPEWVTIGVDPYPWTIVAVAAIKLGRIKIVKDFDQNVQLRFPNRAYPWYIMESGWRIRYLLFWR